MRACIHAALIKGNTMNKDQIEGRKKEITGKIKEVAGNIIGDKTMEAKGKLKKQVGKAQAGYGDVKADVKKAVG
jgi:uncharacterized protein YjbJ (UPF0337 family)